MGDIWRSDEVDSHWAVVEPGDGGGGVGSAGLDQVQVAGPSAEREGGLGIADIDGGAGTVPAKLWNRLAGSAVRQCTPSERHGALAMRVRWTSRPMRRGAVADGASKWKK